VSSITEAASVLLARGPGSPEVLVVRRAENLRFFGGFLAFPGGKVASTDAEVLPLLSPSPPQQPCQSAASPLPASCLKKPASCWPGLRTVPVLPPGRS
jgi:hypothetical protein